MLFEHICKEISFAPFRVGKLILYESTACTIHIDDIGLLIVYGVLVLVKFHQKHSFVVLMKIVVLKGDISYTLHAHVQLDNNYLN